MNQLIKHTGVLSFTLLFSLPSFAGMECKRTHLPESTVRVSEAALNAAARSTLITSLKSELRKKTSLKKYINDNILQQAMELVASPDQPIYHTRLQTFTATLAKNPSASAVASVRLAMRSVLSSRMRTKDVDARITAFLEGRSTLKQALGEMTAQESLHSYIGENGIRRIDPDSLVGRYLSEAGTKKGGKIAQAISSFATGPRKTTRGDSRLIVAIDRETFPIFKKLMMQDQLLIHSHEPRQGTLHMTFNGKNYDWFGGGRAEAVPYRQGHMYPPIVLATSEAQRVQLFFSLMMKNNDLARHPWKLGSVDPQTGKVERYCAVGGYTSCTQWFGNIPMGDQLVTEYMMPGKVDGHASISLYSGAKDKAPRTQELGTYNGLIKRQENYYVNGRYQTRPVVTETAVPLAQGVESLVRLVWKENENNMQLWQVLGLKRQQEQGELANPGYVAYAEIAGTSNDRIPVIFVYTDNATQALNAQQIQRNIHAY